ncbi:hypothetical protein SDC9_162576 [bioreactor metagenome]|uniref:DnaB/C C-terminal domain-containing protein n=1 Tax=bioreactor metagenome TaxID=1076179 RepID=A0A645FNH8_9ZZZZ
MFYFRLLETLCAANGHYLDISDERELAFLARSARVSEEKAREMLAFMAKYRIADGELLKEGIIWLDDFVKTLEPLYKKRVAELPQRPTAGEEEVSVTETTQRKEKKRKEKKSEHADVVVVTRAHAQDNDDDAHIGIRDLFALHNGSDLITGVSAKLIAASVRKYGAEVASAAVEQCARYGKKPWPYIERTLEGWYARGITTREAGLAYEAQVARRPKARAPDAFDPDLDDPGGQYSDENLLRDAYSPSISADDD